MSFAFHVMNVLGAIRHRFEQSRKAWIECLAARAAIESSVAALLRIVRSEIQTAIAPVSSFVEFWLEPSVCY